MPPGLVKARRGAFIRKGVLSREAEMALFELAERMSEGEVHQGADGPRYAGSTMLSVDLESLRKRWRGTLDEAELVSAVTGSVRVRIRVMRLACADAAQRTPELPLGTADVNTRVYVRDGALLVDVDLEAPLGVRWRAGSSRR